MGCGASRENTDDVGGGGTKCSRDASNSTKHNGHSRDSGEGGAITNGESGNKYSEHWQQDAFGDSSNHVDVEDNRSCSTMSSDEVQRFHEFEAQERFQRRSISALAEEPSALKQTFKVKLRVAKARFSGISDKVDQFTATEVVPAADSKSMMRVKNWIDTLQPNEHWNTPKLWPEMSASLQVHITPKRRLVSSSKKSSKSSHSSSSKVSLKKLPSDARNHHQTNSSSTFTTNSAKSSFHQDDHKDKEAQNTHDELEEPSSKQNAKLSEVPVDTQNTSHGRLPPAIMIVNASAQKNEHVTSDELDSPLPIMARSKTNSNAHIAVPMPEFTVDDDDDDDADIAPPGGLIAVDSQGGGSSGAVNSQLLSVGVLGGSNASGCYKPKDERGMEISRTGLDDSQWPTDSASNFGTPTTITTNIGGGGDLGGSRVLSSRGSLLSADCEPQSAEFDGTPLQQSALALLSSKKNAKIIEGGDAQQQQQHDAPNQEHMNEEDSAVAAGGVAGTAERNDDGVVAAGHDDDACDVSGFAVLESANSVDVAGGRKPPKPTAEAAEEGELIEVAASPQGNGLASAAEVIAVPAF